MVYVAASPHYQPNRISTISGLQPSDVQCGLTSGTRAFVFIFAARDVRYFTLFVLQTEWSYGWGLASHLFFWWFWVNSRRRCLSEVVPAGYQWKRKSFCVYTSELSSSPGVSLNWKEDKQAPVCQRTRLRQDVSAEEIWINRIENDTSQRHVWETG